MTRNPGRLLTICIVTLCVALTVAFAQAAAASIVNGVQHHAGAAADHDHVSLSAAVFDHDNDEPASDFHPGVASDDGVDQDTRTAHHHHSDGPAAGLTSAAEVATAISYNGERLLLGPDDVVRATGSPGPERPPRLIASRV